MRKCFSVKTTHAAKVRSDPEFIFMINAKAYNNIIADGIFSIGIVQVLFKMISSPVETDQPSSIGTDPDITLGILGEWSDIIIGQAGGILRVIAVNSELVAIPAIEAILGTKPEKPCPILKDTGDIALGQAIIGAEMGEFDRDGLGKRAQRQAEDQ